MATTEFDSYPVTSKEELDIFIERNVISDWPDLDLKKKAFAIEYAFSYNHREAAKEVGFSAGQGIKLIRDPLVVSYIEHLQKQKITSNIITKDYINTQYIKLLEIAMGEVEVPMVDGQGNEFTGKKTLVGEAINIVKEMAKSIEYAKDTGAKTAPVDISINFHDMFGGTKTLPVTIDGDVIDNG